MACQQTISELIGVTTTGMDTDLLEQCCSLTGTIGSETTEGVVIVSPSPQHYEGDCPAPVPA